MKVVILKAKYDFLKVVARNRKMCVQEMKKSFPNWRISKVISRANNITGDLGVYLYAKVD